MTTVIDLNAECAKLTMLKNRMPSSSEAERNGAFARVAPYRDGAIFTAKFAGKSAWERHPRGEEIVQIIDGSTILHLLTDEGKQSLSLTAGMIAIVPTTSGISPGQRIDIQRQSLCCGWGAEASAGKARERPSIYSRRLRGTGKSRPEPGVD